MKRFAILLLLLSATTSYATPYDLSSNEAELVKNVNTKTSLDTKLNQGKTQFGNLPKVENQNAIIGADLLEKGNLKVTKKICVHGETGETTTASFSYDVNIGIKVIFI